MLLLLCACTPPGKEDSDFSVFSEAEIESVTELVTEKPDTPLDCEYSETISTEIIPLTGEVSYRLVSIYALFDSSSDLSPRATCEASYPRFLYDRTEDAPQYNKQREKYINDLNAAIERETDTWLNLASDIFQLSQSYIYEYQTFTFGCEITSEIYETEGGDPAVVFHVLSIYDLGNACERHWDVTFWTHNGCFVNRTYEETHRVY